MNKFILTVCLTIASVQSQGYLPRHDFDENSFRNGIELVGSFVKNFVSSLEGQFRGTTHAETVRLRLWMADGDQNGCGLYFGVWGVDGTQRGEHFPRLVRHKGCRRHKGPTYQFRMTSPRSVYDQAVHLGNQHVSHMEIAAEGWEDTWVNSLCILMHERTIAGGGSPRTVCINNKLLHGCRSALRHPDYGNGFFRPGRNDAVQLHLGENMLFTKSRRGIHKMILRDVPKLVDSYERLVRNHKDRDARQHFCSRVELIHGIDDPLDRSCPAQKCLGNRPRCGPWEKAYPLGCARYD